MRRRSLDWFLGLILFISNFSLAAQPRLQAQDGVLDLQNQTFQGDVAVDLRGEWWVFSQGLTEEDFRTGRYLNLPHLKYPVPSPIVDHLPEADKLERMTFVLTVKNIKSSVPLGILFSPFLSRHQTSFWLPEARSFKAFPAVGLFRDEKQPGGLWAKKYVAELDHSVQSLVIAIEYQQFLFANGLIDSPKLGHAEMLHQEVKLNDIESAFVLGVFTLLILNNLLLFLVRRKDWPSLCLAVYCALLLMRFLGTEFYICRLFRPITDIYPLNFYFLAIGGTISAPVYGFFLSYTFDIKTIKSWHLFALTLSFLFLVMVALQPKSGSLLFIPMAINHVILLVSVIRCARHRKENTGNFQFVIGGLAFFVAGFTYDVLNYYLAWQTPYLGHYGMLIFTFSQTIIVARNFARAHNMAEHLSRDLQREVERQTEKLRLQKEKLEDQQKSLSKIHDDLKESDEMKTRFFRSISHELRTPLTMILGTLQESDDQDRLKRSVSVASRHAKRLYRLVNQLLDFQKVSLSKVHLRLEKVDLETFLPGLAEYVGASCQSQGIQFEYRVNAKIHGGWVIFAQIDALEKILFNYIGNALKFTPQGGTITLQLDLHGLYARISVIDSGCGIPLDQQSKLFKLFSQIEGPQQQARQGTGLGLALVKELTVQMEGRIGVASEVDKGSEFFVEFPRHLAEAHRYAILLVGASRQIEQALRDELRRLHMDSNLASAADAFAAESIIKNWPVQVVLVSSSLGSEAGTFLELAAGTNPHTWRVMLTDPQRRSDLKNISAQTLQAVFSWPLDPEFFLQLQTRIKIGGMKQDIPVLDLVYVDDEATMRNAFLETMQRYSLIERFRIVESPQAFRDLLPHYRIKAVIIDANLEESGDGVPLLAQTARLYPDTYRVLFTGDNTNELLAAALQEGHAQYIIYKPADFQKEFKVIEDIISKSRIGSAELILSQREEVNRDWQLAGSFSTPGEPLTATPDDPPVQGGLGTVLIVDDLIDMRNILHDILHTHGYRILHAASGQEALERICSKRESIDLIITDWMMPGLSGPELIKKLHALEDFESIPTIILTAKSDESNRSEGMRVGASAYLSKPFDSMELISITENLLDLKKREKKIVELNRFINENVLQRFLPPALVQDLVSGKTIFDDSARMHSITVLFADLVNFTQSTERLGPTRIARILNSFLVSMTDVIFSEGGTIDKFIGDAILVFFGAPTLAPASEQVERITRCALRMQEALEELNRQWTEQEQYTFQMRIGIHHGPAIVGSFGGRKRSDYTAIGNTVNLAARVESQAQPGEILMTAAVRDYLLEDCWEYAGSFRLKGVEAETSLYRLKGKVIKSAA